MTLEAQPEKPVHPKPEAPLRMELFHDMECPGPETSMGWWRTVSGPTWLPTGQDEPATEKNQLVLTRFEPEQEWRIDAQDLRDDMGGGWIIVVELDGDAEEE